MRPDDLTPAGRVLSRAFNSVFEAHGYPPPFRGERSAEEIADWYLSAEAEDCMVAEIRGQVVGMAFLHCRGLRASIGPIAVDPRYQNLHLGRLLMERLLARAESCRSIRLFQDAFNADSFALYSKLGFRAVETVPIMLAKAGAGSPSAVTSESQKSEREERKKRRVKDDTIGGTGTQSRLQRSQNEPDTAILQINFQQAERVAAIDQMATGASRLQDLRYILSVGLGLILQQEGRDCGYVCAYTSHGGVYVGPGTAPGEAQFLELLKALRRHYPRQGMIFRLPARNHSLLRQLLQDGFRISSLGTLMVRGEYEAPASAEILAVFPESL